MINFYNLYNKKGLDNEYYGLLLNQLDSLPASQLATLVLKPIEHIIMKDPDRAYVYAKHVIKRRWPEVEDIIMKDAVIAYWYARDVIKGRFIDAEPIIRQDESVSYAYKRDIINGLLYINTY